MANSKFNVSSDKEKRTHNNIVFDSQLEMKYYRDVLLPKVESGDIKHYELQKKYILQEGFDYNGKHLLPITYVADFYIEYANGEIEVIDTKGMPDSVAKLKRKLFLMKYPNISYRWMSYIKKYGGWNDYDEIKKLRREDKKKKEELKENE